MATEVQWSASRPGPAYRKKVTADARARALAALERPEVTEMYGYDWVLIARLIHSPRFCSPSGDEPRRRLSAYSDITRGRGSEFLAAWTPQNARPPCRDLSRSGGYGAMPPVCPAGVSDWQTRSRDCGGLTADTKGGCLRVRLQTAQDRALI